MAAALASLTEALLDAARRAGAESADAIAISGTSQSIDIRAGRVHGIRLANGDGIAASTIVLNADAAAVGSGAFGPAAAQAVLTGNPAAFWSSTQPKRVTVSSTPSPRRPEIV